MSNPPRQPSFIHVPEDYFVELPITDIFKQQQPIEIEIGSGDGSFLAAYSAANPQTNFLGIERLLGRLRKLDRKLARAGVESVRLMLIEASYFVRFMVPGESIQAIHIYFPDPWPKRRHHKNRLITPEFPNAVLRLLKPGGMIHLRTDDVPYFELMQEDFGGNTQFKCVPCPESLLSFKTDFEIDFNSRGIPTQHITYQRS